MKNYSYGSKIASLRNDLQNVMRRLVDAKSVLDRASLMREAELLEDEIKHMEQAQLEDMAYDLKPSLKNDPKLLLVAR